MCDLGLSLAGTDLDGRIQKVLGELERRNIAFRPHFWISDEWFTPDGVPGVAVPFYLAHPRLMQLERQQMLEVEGGTHEWCMRLLRHEVGHAVANAYRLHRRRNWVKVFGKSTAPYPDYYQPRPYSKRFVLHLDYWYAQSHPTEDFAETFAVWLTPSLAWRKRYAGWGALKKLEYVDKLMHEIAGNRPLVTSRSRVDRLESIRTTLREHYREKQARYGTVHPEFYDRDLRRIFADSTEVKKGETAAKFLNRIRPELRRRLAEWTGEYQYTIDQALKEMISRCRQLKLRVRHPDDQTKLEAVILLTIQTMNYLHSGHHRLAI
ncbi:MAG: putative zinc-binding metallopeptidase [Phycisphaerae bacterium]